MNGYLSGLAFGLLSFLFLLIVVWLIIEWFFCPAQWTAKPGQHNCFEHTCQEEAIMERCPRFDHINWQVGSTDPTELQ